MTVDCRAVATGAGDDLYALRVELVNRTPEPLEIPSDEPFLGFSIEAASEGEPVPVHRPALDIGVHPVTLRVPAGGTLTLETPIRLRIAEGAQPGTDGFIWTIPRARQAVSLELALTLPLPGQPAAACPVVFA